MRSTVLCVLLVAACGGAEPSVNEPTVPATDELAVDSEPALAAPAPDQREPDVAPMLTRTDLRAVLDAGPGAFLARFEVRAYFDGKRFSGWEVVGFAEPESKLASAGLLPGDVVTKVNEHSLERPEQLQELWADLHQAPAIVVTGLREGAPFELRFEVGDSGAGSPSQDSTP